MQEQIPKPRQAQCQTAVIGAGVIGLTIALRLAHNGHEVTLIAPDDPSGEGASFGNAGVIADYAVLPLGNPGLLRDLPRLLLSSTSPLSIRATALAALTPWLLRFLRQSLPGPARRNAQALAGLLSHAGTGWRALADEVGGTGHIRADGVLHLFESPRDMAAAQADLSQRQALGVGAEFIAPAAIEDLEPALGSAVASGKIAGATWFPGALSLSDPNAMIRKLTEAVARSGVQRIFCRATGLQPDPRGGAEIRGPGFALRARHVVIAAGACSAALAAQAGCRIPLETERGYHLEYDASPPGLGRPVSPERRGFYFCPMNGRLRVAGTVEMGGLTAPASPRRLRWLDASARHFLPDLPAPGRNWLGFRPSLPDSLPVIGPVPGARGVWLAFGHGHLGLTLAPITADLVSAGIDGRADAPQLAPFRAGRF